MGFQIFKSLVLLILVIVIIIAIVKFYSYDDKSEHPNNAEQIGSENINSRSPKVAKLEPLSNCHDDNSKLVDGNENCKQTDNNQVVESDVKTDDDKQLTEPIDNLPVELPDDNLPIKPVDNVIDKPVDEPKPTPFVLIQDKGKVKDIRDMMIGNVNDLLSDDDLNKIESYKEDPTGCIETIIDENSDDNWPSLGNLLKMNLRVLSHYATDDIKDDNHMNFVAIHLKTIAEEVGIKIESDDFTMLEKTSTVIELLKLFLMYEYISLCDESGDLRDTDNSIHKSIMLVTSKVKNFDDNYKAHLMYYDTARLLSNYLFDFEKYRNKVERVSSWKKKFEDSVLECKEENFDDFEFYQKLYKALKIE